MPKAGFYRSLAVGLCLLAASWVLVACAAKTGAKPAVPPRTTLIGMVRLVGNEPFTQLVLAVADGQVLQFSAADAERYHDVQNHRVSLTAAIQEKSLTLANGRKAGSQFILVQIADFQDLGR